MILSQEHDVKQLSIISGENGCKQCEYGLEITANCNGQIRHLYVCEFN